MPVIWQASYCKVRGQAGEPCQVDRWNSWRWLSQFSGRKRDTRRYRAEVTRGCAGHEIGGSGDMADIKEANEHEEATSNIHSLTL